MFTTLKSGFHCSIYNWGTWWNILYTPSSRMFQELDWLPMGSRIKYNKAVLTYKALNNMTPEYITKLLTPMSQTHSLNLRSGENGTLYVPLSRTTVYSGAFSCLAARLWNSLPYAIRNSESLNTFKKSIKPLCLALLENGSISVFFITFYICWCRYR